MLRVKNLVLRARFWGCVLMIDGFGGHFLGLESRVRTSESKVRRVNSRVREYNIRGFSLDVGFEFTVYQGSKGSRCKIKWKENK